jgi:iron complex transport system permease protein
VKGRRALALAAAATVATALVYLAIHREPPGPRELVRWLGSLFGGEPVGWHHEYTFAHIRLPRLLVALFGGASLALAGTVMQATFRNPLASPDVVGTAAGAALGGALVIVGGWMRDAVLVTPVGSFAGALAVTWLVFVLARSHGRFSVTTLLLAGIAMNTLVGACTSFVVMLAVGNYTASSEVLFWLMGGLDARGWEHAAITAGGCGVFAALIAPRARELDLLTLSDDTAHSLGVDAQRARRWLVWCACGLTATTVANTGGIAFLGLVAPHLARLLVGPSHRLLLPMAALVGALLLAASDLACRLAPPDASLRLGVVTAFLGAPYFLYLLARHRRGDAL